MKNGAKISAPDYESIFFAFLNQDQTKVDLLRMYYFNFDLKVSVTRCLQVLGFTLLACVCSAQTSTGDYIEYNYYGVKEGLPTRSVDGVVTTDDGLIWLNTYAGLVRFDGYRMHLFSSENNRRVAGYTDIGGRGEIMADTFQNLIIRPPLTSDSLEFFNTRTLHTHTLRFSKLPEAQGEIRALCLSPQRKLFVFSTTDTKAFLYRFNEDYSLSLFSSFPFTACAEKSYHLSAGTDNNFYLLNNCKNSLQEISKTGISDIDIQLNDPGRAEEKILFHVDRRERVWISKSNFDPVYCYDAKSKDFTVFPLSGQDKTFNRIWEDKQGNLIFANRTSNYTFSLVMLTIDGTIVNLSKILDKESKRLNLQGEDFRRQINIASHGGFYEFFFRPSDGIENYLTLDLDPGEYGNVMRAFVEDTAGNIYTTREISRNSGEQGSLFKLDKDTRAISVLPIKVNGQIKTDECSSSLLIRGRKLYSTSCGGQRTGFIHINDVVSMERKTVRVPVRDFYPRVFAQKDDNIWLVTYRKSDKKQKIFRFDLTKEVIEELDLGKDADLLTANIVDNIAIGKDGSIWLASSRGLIRLNEETGQLTEFRDTSGENLAVKCIHPEKDRLLIGTINRGIVVFDLRSKQFSDFRFSQDSPEKGAPVTLSNSSIAFIEPIAENEYFIGTFNGLNRIHTHEGTVRVSGLTDGLSNYEFNRLSSFRANDGRFYLGGINGFDAFFPGELSGAPLKNPVLTRFYKFDKDDETETSVYSNFSEKNSIVLPPDNLYFGFEFSLPNYAGIEGNRYKVFLRGYDESPSLSTSVASVRYNKLPPGEYTLEIQAYDNQGNESQVPLSIPIVSTEHFYKKPWFLLSALLSILTLTFVFTRRYTGNKYRAEAEAQREKERIQRKFTELELEALRAQLNPHFIFNALGAVQHFVERNNTEKAGAYLSDFARLMRMFLESSKNQTITLDEELELLRMYTDLEQLRFGNRFTTEFCVEEDLDAHFIEIPSSLLQPYVENAVNHGLFHRGEGGRLQISIKEISDDEIEIRIKDNGVGRVRSAEIKANSLRKHKSRATQIISDRIKSINSIGNFAIHTETKDAYPGEINCGTEVIITIREED